MSRYLYSISIALFFGGHWLAGRDEASFDGPVLMAIGGGFALAAFLWSRRRREGALAAGAGATAGPQPEQEVPRKATAASPLMWAFMAGFDLMAVIMPVRYVSLFAPQMVGRATTDTVRTVISALIVATCAGVIALLWFAIGKPLRDGGSLPSSPDGRLRIIRMLMLAWAGAHGVFVFGAFMAASYQGTVYPSWVALCGAILMFLARPWQPRLATLSRGTEADSGGSAVTEARVQPGGEGTPGPSDKDHVSLKRVALLLVLLLVGLVGGLGTLIAVQDQEDEGGEEWTPEQADQLRNTLAGRLDGMAELDDLKAYKLDLIGCTIGEVTSHPPLESGDRIMDAYNDCSSALVYTAKYNFALCREQLSVGSILGVGLLAAHTACQCMAKRFDPKMSLAQRTSAHSECHKGSLAASYDGSLKPAVGTWSEAGVANLQTKCLAAYDVSKVVKAFCSCVQFDVPRVFEETSFEKDHASVLDDPAVQQVCDMHTLPETMAELGMDLCQEAMSKLDSDSAEKYCGCVIDLSAKDPTIERRRALAMCMSTLQG